MQNRACSTVQAPPITRAWQWQRPTSRRLLCEMQRLPQCRRFQTVLSRNSCPKNEPSLMTVKFVQFERMASWSVVLRYGGRKRVNFFHKNAVICGKSHGRLHYSIVLCAKMWIRQRVIFVFSFYREICDSPYIGGLGRYQTPRARPPPTSTKMFGVTWAFNYMRTLRTWCSVELKHG